MKKVYFLFLLCCTGFVALSQTTVTIYATGATGSFLTGNATPAARNDDTIVTTASTQRGYAVFSLASLPAGVTITSCTINYDVVIYGGAGAASGWHTYGFAGDLSTVTSAATLFADMIAGTSLSTATYGVGTGDRSLASTAATDAFIQSQIGNTVSICWTGGGAITYSIMGETGVAAPTDATGANAPYLSVTYCTPPTGVTATAAPNPVCAGSVLTLTGAATGATSYSWAGPGGFTSTLENPTLIAATASAGTYTVTAISLCGTSRATATATTGLVTVSPVPAITGGLNICLGQFTTLADAATGGIWSSVNTAVATTDNFGNVFSTGTGTSEIDYTTPAGCTAATTVTVVAAPTGITGGPAVCPGLSTSLSDAPGPGTWSSSNTAVATINSSGTLFGVGSGSTIVTYTIGTGCRDTMTFFTSPLPASITGSSSVICTGYTATLNDGSTGGAWSSSAPGIATVSTTGAVTALTGGTAVISYTLPTGCYATANVIVNPAAAPDPITGATSECSGTNTLLHDASPTGNWSSSNTGIALIYPTGVVYGISGGTATITYTSAATGCYNTETFTVVPTPPAFGGSLSVCVGITSTLTDALTGGTWTSSNTAVANIDPVLGVVTGAAAGTTLITYTVPPGCPLTEVLTVTPVPAPIGGSAVVCTGSTTQLTDAVSGGVWSTATTTFATVGSTTGIVTGVSAGATDVSYTLGSGCYVVMGIADAAGPPAITGGPVSICAGGTVEVLLTDAVTGGTWTASNAAITPLATGPAPGTEYVLGATAGIDTISYVTTTVCAATLVVTVNPLPAAIGGSPNICTGVTSTLTDALTGGTWSSSTTTVAVINATTGAISGVAGAAGLTSTITYTLPTGCSTTLIVTDNDPPAALTGGPVALCVGASVTLTETSTGGTWSASNTAVSTVDATGDVFAAGGGTDTVLYTIGSGCAAEMPVTVNPLPAAIGGNANICTGVTATLTDAVTGGTWSSSATNVATIDPTTGVITGVVGGTGLTSTITYTLGTGCSVTLTVTDTDPPAAITGSAAICVGASVTLTETSAGGTWSSSNAAISTIDATTGLTTDVYGAGGGTDTVLYTLASGCFSETAITVDPLPAAIGGTTSVCTGSTSVLTDGTSGGTWSSLNTAIASIDPTSGTVTGEGTGSTTVSYIVTTTGCFVTATITDNDTPSAFTGTPVVCAGGATDNTTTLTETVTGGTWSSGNTAAATVGVTSGIVYGVGAGTAIISYIMPTGCNTGSPVTVNPIPDPIGGATAVCTGLTTVLTDASTGGSWSSANSAIASIDPTSGTVTGEFGGPTGSTTTISYTFASGCSVTSSMTDYPPPSAIGGLTAVCVNATISLTETTAGGSWSSSNNGLATVDPFGNVTGVFEGAVTISYTMPTGCYSTLDITVNPIPDAIAGATSICTGSTTLLTDGITTGTTWSTSSAAIASVDATGTVYGNGSGIATISYTFTATGCFVILPVTVNPTPVAIAGPTAVCQLDSVNLTDGSFGGTWSSSDNGIATVDGAGSASEVTGVSSGTANISYIITGTGCFVTSVITVNPIPDAITGTNAVCTAGTTVLTETTTASGAWSSSSSAIASIDPTSGTVTGEGAGIATISFTITATGCFVIDTMTDNNPPTPIVGTTPICIGASVTFTDGVSATSAGGSTWSSGFPGIANINAVTGTVFATLAGVDTIYYTIEACPAVSFPITVNPSPTTITGASTVCVGDSITLTEATPGGFWGSSFPGVALVSDSGVVTGENAGVVTINYTIGGCTPVSHNVTVYPTPTSISGLTQVCATLTIPLTDGVSGGIWTSSTSTVATVNRITGDVLGVAEGTAVISYTIPGGCYKTLLITVNPLPAPITFPVAVVCQGSAITYSEGSTGGAWSSSNTAVASVGSGIGIVTGEGAGVANIIYTFPTGCLVFASVTVNPLPLPSTGPGMVCVDNTITLVNTSPGGPGSWSSSNTSVAEAGLGTGIITGVSPGTTSIVFSLPTGCNTATTVTVNPLPASIFGLSSVCVGSAITLSDITPGGTWSSSGPAATVVSGSGVVNGSSAGVANISYILTATGCSAWTTVTVYPLPAAISGPVAVCSGASIVLVEGDTGGIWSSSDITLATVGSTTGVVTGVVTGVAASAVTILYTFPSGCSVGTSITSEPTPVATITPGGPTSFCLGGSVTLAASTGATYQWYNDGVVIPTAVGPNYSATSTGSYAVRVSNAFLCADTSSAVAVSNGIYPVLSDTGAVSICAGNNLVLTVTNGGAVGVLTYIWEVNDVVIPGAIANTFAATAPGRYYVQLTVAGASGTCAVISDSVTITVNPLPTPPISYDGTSLSTTNTYVSYEWYLNTVFIPGATSSSYVPVTNGSYRVLVVDAHGCDNYSAEYQIGGVGVKQVINAKDIKIYPNPATSVVHIDAPVSVRAVITSVEGKVLLDQDNAQEVNINNLADGLYLILIYDENGNQLKLEKLIKQ